jgi:hypothetical protein
MIENSDNPIIQSILDKCFGSVLPEPVKAKDTTTKSQSRDVELI